MIRSTVTLDLAPDVYDQLLQRARSHQRRVEDEASLTLAAAVTPLSTLPDDLEAVLTALADLDNETLERVSYSQPTVEDGILLDALIDKRRRRGLNPTEERWLDEIAERHDRVLVLRARALALLHERGVDISERIARA